MASPLCFARFLGNDLDRTALGLAGDRVLGLAEGNLGSAGANYSLIADPIDGVGSCYRLLASGTAGTRGPDITFRPEYKPLGDPQSDAGNINSHQGGVYIHRRIAVQPGTFDGATGTNYVELFTSSTGADAREMSERLILNGTLSIVNRSGAASGTPTVASAAGAFALGTKLRLQTHIRPTIGATPGRMAFRIETGVEHVYSSVVELLSTDISPNAIQRIRQGARDVGQNLGTNGHPDVLVYEFGAYVKIPEIDGALTDEDCWRYATPDPFALCRTTRVGATAAKLLIAIPDNAIDDGGEADYEFGKLTVAPSAGDAFDPWNIADEDVEVTHSDTVTLGAVFRGFHVGIDGIEPATWYAWRVSAGGETSTWRAFRTPPAPGANEPLRIAVLAHCHSDERRAANIAARRIAEKVRRGEIDLVIDGSKGVMHGDNNGSRAPALTLAQMFENFVAAGSGVFMAELSRTGVPIVSLRDDYYGFPTNQGAWCANIPLSYPTGHPSAGTPIFVFSGYDADGDGDFTSINEVAADGDFDFTAGRLVTYADAAALGVQVDQLFFQAAQLDDSEVYEFIQWGSIDLILLHDRRTRDPDTDDFFGAAQVAAVTARILASNGARQVEVWTPSSVGDEDAAAGESWASWPVERAAAMQAWEDAAEVAGKWVAYRSSCKYEPFVGDPALLAALLDTDRGRINGYSAIGKTWGRIPNANASLVDGGGVAAGILAAFIADASNSLVDPYDGGSRTVEAGDHVGWLPLLTIDPTGPGSSRVQILDLIDLEPLVDARYGAFDVESGLGLGAAILRGRGRGRGR